MCRRALASRSRHGFKKQRQAPSLRPTEFLRDSHPALSAPGTSLSRLNQPAQPRGRRRRPRPSSTGGDWSARPSLRRSRPAHASLPVPPPSQSGKTAVGPGWQPTAGGECWGEEPGTQEGAGRPGARKGARPAGRRRGDKMAALAEGQA